MGEASYIQASFLGGEVSNFARGRYDDKEYRTLLAVCFNGLPVEADVWVRRPGAHLVVHTKGGAPGRVINFNFRQASPYTMVFTDGFLRFTTGLNPVMTNDQVSVSSITADNPAKVNTATPHAFATNDTVMFNTLGATVPLLQGRQFVITKTGASQFTIADAITGASIDGATLGVGGLAAGAKVARILEIATAYVGGIWSGLRAVQTDVQLPNGSTVQAVLLHAAVKPYTLTVATQPSAANFATFTLAPVMFKDGPYFDPVPGGTLATPSALIGIITLTMSFNAYDATRAYSIGDYVTSAAISYRSLTDANLNNTPAISPTQWVAVSSADAIGPNGFQGSDVGRMVRLFSEPAIWAAGTSYAKDAVVAYGGAGLAYTGAAYWKSLVAANLGNTPGTDLTKWALFPTGAIWTWGKITSLSNIIDRLLAGSTSIGDLTGGGGLNAAFDGIFSQTSAASAGKQTLGGFTVGGTIVTVTSFVGKNYTAASDQVIAQATIYPSSDNGFAFGTYLRNDGFFGSSHPLDPLITFNLRGKASAPGSSSDGTLLGTLFFGHNSTSPATIISTDQVTAWKFVWVEMVATFTADPIGVQSYNLSETVAELSFFAPTGAGTSQGVNVQIIGDALLYTTSIRTWRLGLFSDTTGWPSVGTYHEGRLWLSGIVANRVDASFANDPFNFAPTTPQGAVTAANAISYTFAAPDVNPIFWMEPDYLGIVCGTQAGEWLIQASALNQPLTPTSIQAHNYTRNGCANIEPKRADLTLAVVRRYQRTVLEYFSDVFSGKFVAQSLSKWIKHLTKTRVQELAYQKELAPILWQRMGDGSLVGQTYQRTNLVSSQPPNFMGAHRHLLGSGRLVESICNGANGDGTLETLVMVTNDPATNIRHVEILTDIAEEDTELADAAYLDDAITPSSTSTSNVTPAPLGGLTLNGLWPLNGKLVTAWIGGLDCGDYTVVNGSITVPYGDGISGGTGTGLFTAVFAGALPLSKMLVGFTYTSQGQIVRPHSREESGARNGPAFGKLRRQEKFAAELEGTQGVSFGTDFSHLKPARFVFDNDVAYTVLQQFTGVYKDTLDDDASLDSQLCWQVTRPYICNVNTIGGFIETSDE